MRSNEKPSVFIEILLEPPISVKIHTEFILMCRRRGLDEQTKDWGSKLKRTIKLQGYEGICAFLSQITTLKCLVCACSCRRVYKPQVGSWSLLISWEPAEWDSTHLQHPLYVSDWTCLLAKPQKKKKQPVHNNQYLPIVSMLQWSQTGITATAHEHYKQLILSHDYVVLCTSMLLWNPDMAGCGEF